MLIIFLCADDSRGINENIYYSKEEALDGILDVAPILEPYRERLQRWLEWAQPGAATSIAHSRVQGYLFCATSMEDMRLGPPWEKEGE